MIKKISPLLLAALLGSTSVLAQESSTDNSDRIIYEPAFFAQYTPLTALDMVNQVPGYSLRGESQNRGFSQGEGSLLINGKRPSTKDNSAQALLARISASNVLRIELLKEGSSELAGQSGLIVNLVTKDENETSGSWRASAKGHYEGYVFPEGRLSVNGKADKLTYTLGLELSRHSDFRGGDEKVYDANLDLIEIRDEDWKFKAPNWALTTALGYAGDNGSQLNLNFKGERWVGNWYETSNRFLPGPNGGYGDAIKVTDYHELETEWNYEIGGDYSFPLGSGTMKFVGLTRMEDSKYSNEFEDLPEVGNDYFFNSTRNPVEKENIARALYTFEPSKGSTIEWAIEGVKNSLDTTSTFEENTGGGFQPVIIDGSNSLVEERRAESSLLYSRTISDALSMQASFAVEYSELKVNEDSSTARSYWRPKGFVSFNYKIDKQNTLRTRFEKSVGQLNFNIFASIVNVTEGTTNSQNTSIVPDQFYTAEASWEHRWGKDNIVTVEGSYSYIEDFVTNIPLPGGGEGFGNYDHASHYGVEVNATISTDDWGAKGGKITFLSMMREARIEDPITGETRKIDHFQCCGALVKFRQDIQDSNWAYELQINHGTGWYMHRLNQKVTLRNSFPDYYRAMVQNKNVLGLNMELEVRWPFGVTQHYIRDFYDGDRNGAFLGREERYRFKGAQFFFRVTDTF